MATIRVSNGVKPAFFSVKNPVMIAKSKRVPSICYPILETERKSIEELASAGLAVLYTNKVRFISGKPYEAESMAERVNAAKEKHQKKVDCIVVTPEMAEPSQGTLIVKGKKKDKDKDKNTITESEVAVVPLETEERATEVEGEFKE